MKYKAIIYEVIEEEGGDICLKRVTSVKKLTVHQIAGAMDVAYNTISTEILSGRLPCQRIGACIRVDIEDFMKWYEDCYLREYERGDVSRTLADVAKAHRN